MRRGLLPSLLLALLLLQGACAARPSAPPADSLAARFPHLEERALLLLLVDRKLYEPFVVDTALEGGVALRIALAETLGRVGDARGRPALERLLVDRRLEVRRAAVFGLGQLGVPEAIQALLRATRDPDPETGRLAVEALARLGSDLAPVRQALEGLPPETVERRLLPPLFRYPNRQLLSVALAGLESEDRRLRIWAAYALARNPLPVAAEKLRALLRDSDPRVRGWAARALGRVGGAGDLDRLLPLLEDTLPGPVIQALRSAHRLVSDGRAAPSDAWRPQLRRLVEDRRTGVRLTALEAAGAWLIDEELGDLLYRRAEHGSGRERELALLALAAGGDPRAWDLTPRFAVSVEPPVRASAAAAAALLGDRERLESLFSDTEGRVRLAALAGLLAGDTREAVGWARRALSDGDPGVRAGALEWLADHPELPVEELLRAAEGGGIRRLVDLELKLVRALTAWGVQEPLERGLVVKLLEDLSRSREIAVRRRAVAGLDELGQPRPAVGAVETARTVAVYREILRRADRYRFADLDTRHGRMRLRLDCPRAPLTCLNFLQLASQGFYDGLIFNRVVPDFVVQGGDPRGDGWGGPGYTIRDEITRIRYERGVLGMALSDPDTGGSQFFITLSPQPHLDGAYTAFGQVVSGGDVLDRIVQGDRILRIREVERGSGGR